MIAVPASVRQATVDAFRGCGEGRRECVVYWVGPATDASSVTHIVHPSHAASPVHYEVDGDWLNRFWLSLAREGESVRLQVHTHGGRACHSKRDDENALVYQEGFMSLVLPGFAMQDSCWSGAFLVERTSDGRWAEVGVGERLLWS